MAPPLSSPPPIDQDKQKKKEKEKENSNPRGLRRNTKSKVALATPSLPLSQTRPDNGILSLRYEETRPAKPPIAVTIAPPRLPPSDIHPALRRPKAGVTAEEEWKRDSGLAPTTTSSKAREGSVNAVESLGVKIDFDSNSAVSKSVVVNKPASSVIAVPTPASDDILKKTESRSSGAGSIPWRKAGGRKSSNAPKPPTTAGVKEFSPIETTIPTECLLDQDLLKSMAFSKRGSMMLGGKKAVNSHARLNATRRQKSFSMLASTTMKVLTEEMEKESQKVRSMYEQGSQLAWEDGRNSSLAQRAHDSSLTTESGQTNLLSPTSGTFDRPDTALSTRNEHELAGGIENWEDINGTDIDRYGFIDLRRSSSRPGTPDAKPPQRVPTVLKLASDAPRKNRRAFGFASSAASERGRTKKAPSRKVSTRSLNSENSQSTKRSHSGRMRAVSNRLPGNRDRRWMDEAGDMLTLPPGLADIQEDEEGGEASTALKRKEWERAEKWRKMAKVVKTGKDGEGMEFEFDPRNPKVIERTWKGIPDRWRAAAWHSFLNASAKKQKDSVPDKEIVASFHKLQLQSSADDTQIDLDVPRTINGHIMFRKRYRGGQRLLFRVLHALSLYFPVTGYVQGMACLAATLLCYYDEEKTFIMLVRMWTLRSLDKLYEPGFGGLMAALDEFQKKWIVGSRVSKKLDALKIEPTAWGTRWYLTLFNYSIPFPAQLRVWDVFMLLGDVDLNQAQIQTTTSSTTTPESPFRGGLDVIHATSAALIDGTREILLDSDFENAMKVLTSFIPVKDEELLMKVTRAEYKLHCRGRRA